MPFGYLDNQNANIYAAGNVGQNFADAAFGLRKLALQRALENERLGIESSYLQLERAKAARQAGMDKVKMDQAMAELDAFKNQQAAARQAASARGALVPFSMQGQPSYDMPRGPLGVMPTPGGMVGAGPTQGAADQLNQRSLANALQFIAAQSPAVAGKQMEPMSVQAGEQLMDPFTRATIAQGPSMNAYQQGMLADRTQLRGIEEERAKAYIGSQQADEAYTRDRMEHPEKYHDTDPYGIKAAMNQSNASTFDSEEAARAKGAKAGDIIYIKGVGKVRLN